MQPDFTPREFVQRWQETQLNERQSYQQHFLDVCRLVNYDTPTGADRHGNEFMFERSVKKDSGAQGYADVYLEGHFAVEYKAPGKYETLDEAYQQLQRYRERLKNPPLLVVTDINNWEIHTNFPNTEKKIYRFTNEQILDSNNRRILHNIFYNPDNLHPDRSAEDVTREAAASFKAIVDNMRDYWEGNPERIAHFLTKLVFCLFAEDVGLLPVMDSGKGLFSYAVENSHQDGEKFKKYVRDLFEAMNNGGDFLMRDVDYFNGALFDDVEVIGLGPDARTKLLDATELNWEYVEPTIFGTLFERAIDPDKRSQLGAHYTGRDDIELIVEPVLMQPLRRAWDDLQPEADDARQRHDDAQTERTRTKYREMLHEMRDEMLRRLRSVTVLDPACGSGNFLYVALKSLLDLEQEVITYPAWDTLQGLATVQPGVHPRQMYGIEKNTIAHSLASIVVWIGYLQWKIHNGYPSTEKPILQDTHGNFTLRDAILTYDADGNPQEPEWPATDVIVGNPPFLGGKRMRGELEDYVDDLFALYENRVPPEADLVTYWFEHARSQIEKGRVKRVGLLATNSIRGGKNRVVLERIKKTGDIFMAWSDREWMLAGAAVRVSMVGFDNGTEDEKLLDGKPATQINTDLTGTIDLTVAKSLCENDEIVFMGITKGGAFDIDEEIALEMMESKNKSELENKDVLFRIYNGIDITRNPRDKWIIDFGVDMDKEKAALYEAPFNHIVKNVKPKRAKNRRKRYREYWWLHAEARPGLRNAISDLDKYIVTPIVSTHRVFVWLDKNIVPDKRLMVFARDDDYFFGVLHSKLHEVWSLRMGSWHGKGNDPRYTSGSVFETFPFPWSPGSEETESAAYQAIAEAARTLHSERDAWLHPSGVTQEALKRRTLTNLYNALATFRSEETAGKIYPAAGNFAPRLDALHQALDEAVCAAYGWSTEILDDEEAMLRQLLALNLERAAKA